MKTKTPLSILPRCRISTGVMAALLGLSVLPLHAQNQNDRSTNAPKNSNATSNSAMGNAGMSGASSTSSSMLKRGDRRFLAKASEDGHAEIALAQLAAQKAESAEVKTYARMLIDDHQKVDQELTALAQKKGAMLDSSPAPHMSATDRAATGTGSSTGVGPRRSSTSSDPSSPMPNSPSGTAANANGELMPSPASGTAQVGGTTSADSMGSMGSSTMGSSSSRTGSMMSNLFGEGRHLRRLSKETGREFDAEFLETAIEDHKDTIALFEKAGRDSSDTEISAFANKHLPSLRDHLMQAQNLAKTVK